MHHSSPVSRTFGKASLRQHAIKSAFILRTIALQSPIWKSKRPKTKASATYYESAFLGVILFSCGSLLNGYGLASAFNLRGSGSPPPHGEHRDNRAARHQNHYEDNRPIHQMRMPSNLVVRKRLDVASVVPTHRSGHSQCARLMAKYIASALRAE